MTSYALEEVLSFYKELPFNYRGSVEEQAKRDVADNPLDSHFALAKVFKHGMRVLDVGCGAGWFSNSLAYNNKADVTAVDFNPVAVKRASEVGRALGLSVQYVVHDLFTYVPEEPYDIVVSMGVLHHTGDCHAAIRHVCGALVKPGGHVYIGLYHTYGRKPFLDYFKRLQEQGANEEVLYEHYRRLHSRLSDEVMLRSWFRDQVLHPHETQHTQKEMNALMKECGMEVVASSINRFEPFNSPADLEPLEQAYEKRGEQSLKDGVYFPGFFIFLAKKL